NDFIGDVWSVNAALAPYYSGITATNQFRSTNNPFATNATGKYIGSTQFFYVWDQFDINEHLSSLTYGDPSFQLQVSYKRANAISVTGSPQTWASGITSSTEDHIKKY